MTSVMEVEQRRQDRIGFEEDAAAVTAVATVGTAARYELLATEADTARPAVTALDEDVDLVDEHVRPPRPGRSRRSSRRRRDDAHVAGIAPAVEADDAV